MINKNSRKKFRTNRSQKSIISSLIILLFLTAFAHADEFKYYFYKGYNFGSQSHIHPISLIVNGGFGIMQMDNRANELSSINFSRGWDNLMRNLKHPREAIKEEGTKYFVTTQLIPFSLNKNESYYWPNYTLHLIGGGMSYRMMTEWFHSHNYKYPTLFSAVTLTAYHFLNEVVENNNFEGYNTDPIADIYIFNPLGMLLFSSEKVARFFSEKLNMTDWSFQATYNPFDKSLDNHGQNFVMKYWLNKKKSIGLFYHFGTHGEMGLSFKKQNGYCFSFAAGLVAKELVEQSDRRDLRQLTADLVPTGGLFWDKDNSLLASFFFSNRLDYKMRLNVYPGLFKIFNQSPGFYIGMHQDDNVSLGITFNFIPIGISKVF